MGRTMPRGPLGFLGGGRLSRLQGRGVLNSRPHAEGFSLPHPSRYRAPSSGRALSWGRRGGLGALGPRAIRPLTSRRDPALPGRGGRRAERAVQRGRPGSRPLPGPPRQPSPKAPPADPLAGTLTRRPSPLPGPPRPPAPLGPAASPPPASPAGGPLGPAAPPGAPGEREGLAEGRSGSCWDL